jgi:hypothetical protein
VVIAGFHFDVAYFARDPPHARFDGGALRSGTVAVIRHAPEVIKDAQVACDEACAPVGIRCHVSTLLA